ncbi:MAG TPA: hypothetical protein PLU49_10435, partial [Saprospiraceae bacterium]|nr:hypothetical protein [Saprospiraceae bacterium]
IMKNFALFLILFFLTIVLTVNSCKKDEIILNDPNTDITNPTSDNNGLCYPRNLSNDFDSVGIYHNDILDEFAEHIDPRGTLSDAFDVMDSVLISEFGSWVQPYLLDSSDVALYFDGLEEDTLKTFISGLSTSSTDKYYMTELVDILARFDGSNACDIIDDIKDMEELLLNNYDPEDLPGTFTMASAGRFSAYYWENYTFPQSRWDWKKFWMVCGDAVGAAAGFFTGFYSSTPPNVIKGIATAVTVSTSTSKTAGDLYDLFTKD